MTSPKNDKPTGPPPDKNKPYIWADGQWYLVATDTSDGVPNRLKFEELPPLPTVPTTK